MYRFLKIVVAILSIIGIVSLVRIILKSTEEIEGLAATGDTSILEPMAWTGYIILGLTLLIVVIFVFRNLFTGGNIRNTLVGVGAFALILIIGYALSGGDPLVGKVYAYDDILATESESRLVGGGLIAFYILSALAIIVMVLSGVKKLIK